MAHEKDKQLMEIPDEEQFIKNFKAVYYAMNAKPDCKTKVFQEPIFISMNDLDNLNETITEKFKAHYEDAGFNISVSVGFKGRESIEFDSWQEFRKYNWKTDKIISSLLIAWEYNARLPKYPIPQLHRITVRFSDEIRPEEMLNIVIAGKLQEMDKLDQEFCPIVARVDFINSILCDELLAIVEKWQNGLKRATYEQNKWYNILRKYSRVLAYAINYISLFVFIWLGTIYINFKIKELPYDTLGAISTNEAIALIRSIIWVVVCCLAVYKIFGIIANYIFALFRENENYHIFKITNGDDIEYQKSRLRVKGHNAKIVFNVIVTMVFNVLCSLLANYLSDIIK